MHTTECLAALRLIGASAAASIVEEAIAMKPRGKLGQLVQVVALALGRDRFERLDQRFYAYPDDIDALMLAYLERVNRLSSRLTE